MASTRSLRASRSPRSSSNAPLNNRIPRRGNDRRNDKAINTAEERRGAPHVTTRKHASTQPSAQALPSPSSTDGVDEDEAAEGDDDDDNDDDLTDVHAPPSDHVEAEDSIQPSNSVSHDSSSRELSSKPNKSSAGLDNNASNHDSMIIEKKSDTSNNLNDPIKSKTNTVLETPKSDGEEDVSDAESANFDLSDDDDDYEGVDNVSIASDDSRDFEADVEREIQAAGEDGIDWDDENTYLYDATLSYDLFGFSYESGMAHAMLDFDLFSPDHTNDLRMTQSAPAIEHPTGQELATEPSAVENMLALDRSERADSDDAVTAPGVDQESMPVDEFKEPSKPGRRADVDDGDTTDEDITWTTVSSPGITLSRDHGTISRKFSKSAKKGKKGRTRLVKRKILPDPNKAIAYSVAAPFGSAIRFCTPRSKTYRWMNLRGSRNSSRASSPTMINLEDAYLQGNTRTGAHITDVINGTLFSALHCRRSSAPDSVENTPALSSFYQPLLGNGEANQEIKATDKPLDDSALALIDFTGGVGAPSANEEPHEPEVSNGEAQVPNLVMPPLVPGMSIDEDVQMTDPMDVVVQPEGSLTTLQIPMTPPSDVDLALVMPISPKKRRLSNRSNDRRKVDSAVKKQRYSLTNEVVA